MPIVVENICKLDRLPVVEEASRARSEEIPVPMRNRRQSFWRPLYVLYPISKHTECSIEGPNFRLILNSQRLTRTKTNATLGIMNGVQKVVRSNRTAPTNFSLTNHQSNTTFAGVSRNFHREHL